MPSKKKTAASDIRVARVQVALEPVAGNYFANVTKDPIVLSGKLGVPVNAPSPIGTALQLMQPDGFAVFFLPNRVDMFVDIPLDIQSSVDKCFEYVSKRIKQPSSLLTKYQADQVRWAGLVSSIQLPNPNARDGFEAAQEWAMQNELPFTQEGKLSQLGYSIGYQIEGIHQIISVQGFGVGPGVLFSGMEYTLDLNDKPLSKPEKASAKIRRLMNQAKLTTEKLVKSGFEKWQ